MDYFFVFVFVLHPWTHWAEKTTRTKKKKDSNNDDDIYDDNDHVDDNYNDNDNVDNNYKDNNNYEHNVDDDDDNDNTVKRSETASHLKNIQEIIFCQLCNKKYFYKFLAVYDIASNRKQFFSLLKESDLSTLKYLTSSISLGSFSF